MNSTPLDQDTAPRNNRDMIATLLGRATAVLVILLALGAFFLSYESLRDLATNSGAIAQGQAWMFPVVIDGAILVFSLSALRASLSGERTHWYMGLVITVTVISVGLNAAHATGGVLSRVMAALPPLLLFGAFESLMKQLASSLAPTAPKKLSKAPVKISEVLEDTTVRRRKVQDLQAAGLSRNAMARQLGVSAATIRRDLAQTAVVRLAA